MNTYNCTEVILLSEIDNCYLWTYNNNSRILILFVIGEENSSVWLDFEQIYKCNISTKNSH